MADKDFRKQCLQCKRLLPQVFVCINGNCEDRYMTLICELCHKDLHNNPLTNNSANDSNEEAVKQVHLNDFLTSIQNLIHRESQVDHASKSEMHAKVVEQIDQSVNTVDEIIARLQNARTNLLNIREQVTNPSAQAKTIYDNLQISTSNYQQIIQSLQQLKSFAQVDGTELQLKELTQTNTVHEVAEQHTRVNTILQILLESSKQSNQQQQLTKEALKQQALEKVNNHLKALNINMQFGSFDRIKIQYDYYQRGYYIDGEYIAYFSERYLNAQELYKYWLQVNSQIEAAQF